MDNMNNKPCFFWLSLLIFCFFLHFHASLAALTTISANQSLSGDQTLVSKDGNFELGFFNPGNSSRYYISMWYKKVSTRTYVWVANRDDSVSDKNSSILTIYHGNLVLLENGNLVWSTNLSSPSPSSGSVEAVLLDNGNLILRDKPNASELESLWQSFDHPTDTWLPGGRIKRDNKTKKPQYLTSWKNSEDPATGLFSLQLDPNGTTSYMILWNKTELYWTSGAWNGHIFSLVPEMRLNYIYNLSFVSNENESYFTYTLYNNSQLSRFVMDVTGQIKQLTWLEDSQEWNLYWSQPSRQCEVYAVCGAFGSCSESSMPYCNCVNGYEPKSQSNWDMGDYSDGCVKSTKFQCESSNSSNGTNDRFLTMPNMALPEHAELLGADNVGECELTCFSNCSCKAYAFYSTDTVCSLWYGDFLNLRQLNKDDSSGQTLFLKLAASEFHDDDPKSSNGISIGVIAGAVGGGVVVILLALVVIVVLRRKKRPGAASNIFSKHYKKNLRKEVVDLPTFDFSVLAYATKNFSIYNKLGEGGFGPVYKGMLIDGQEIAVKRLSKRSTQGLEEFKNEVALIAKLQHRNLIKLLGCCIQGEETMLVYEYMPNKSLDYFVFDEAKKMSLDWVKRFNIISSIVRGLLYLHQDSRLRIIHRDLKTSNILLDLNLEPKISDFGLARIFLGDQIEANTNRVAGTYGYMSPEHVVHGHFSMKSDVFSYGVIVLEIVSGKKNRGFSDPKHYNNLLGYAWRLWTEERALELLDEVLREQYTPFEVIRSIQVGLLCVQQRPEDRPDMSYVVLMLNGEKLLPKPKVPGFYTEKDLSTESDSSSLANHKLCSTIEVSITELDAR